MKQHFFKIMTLCMLSLFGLAACIEQEPECDTCDEQPDGRGILLSFHLDEEEQTRSTLQSSEGGYKEVKEVYLYIFQGNTAEAKCIHAEPVGWKGDPSKEHWIRIDLTTGQEYTFMAVGVDDKAEDVYGFPGNIVKDQTTLGQCMAQLQEKKGKEDMAQAQFFVGSQSKTVTADVEEVALTLRRKVAGILVYLRNIPVKVPYKNQTCWVKALEVRLHQPQHTSLKLYRNGTETIFGEGTLTNSEVLFSLDLTENNKAGFKPDADNRYFVKEGNDSILADSYLAGAYLLPIEKTAGKATLSVNLLGDYTDGSGAVEQKTVLKSYEARYRESNTSPFHTDFDIKENALYSIGKKLNISSTVNDKAADLSGNLLLLEVVPWRPIKVDNSFPTVTGPARIEADYNDQKYVLDSNQDILVITIKPAVDKNPDVKKLWTLSVNYTPGNAEYPEEKPADWIHFLSYNAEGQFVKYTNTLTGYDEQEVTVIINDYTEERILKNRIWYSPEEIQKFKNDIRRAVLELRTEDVEKPYPLQVQQYNTLTIKTNDQYQNPRGITRLDYGCWFDKQTGKVMGRNDSCKIDWGYFKTGNLYVSGDNPMNYTDGEINADKCYNRWKNGNWAAFAYQGSAIQKLTKRFINLQTDANGEVKDPNPANNDDHEKEKNWYMPAYYEMWGITKTADYSMVDDQQLEELMNMHKEDIYWTSSGDDGIIGDAYITRIGHLEKSEHKDKNNFYFARPMIKFKPHSNAK